MPMHRASLFSAITSHLILELFGARKFAHQKKERGPGDPRYSGYHPNEYRSFVGDPGWEAGATKNCCFIPSSGA